MNFLLLYVTSYSQTNTESDVFSNNSWNNLQPNFSTLSNAVMYRTESSEFFLPKKRP